MRVQPALALVAANKTFFMTCEWTNLRNIQQARGHLWIEPH